MDRNRGKYAANFKYSTNSNLYFPWNVVLDIKHIFLPWISIFCKILRHNDCLCLIFNSKGSIHPHQIEMAEHQKLLVSVLRYREIDC